MQAENEKLQCKNYNDSVQTGFPDQFLREKLDLTRKNGNGRGELAISTTAGLVGLLTLVNRRRGACLALVCRRRSAGSRGRKRSQGEHGSDQYG